MKRKIILLILALCAAMLLGTVSVGAASGSCGTEVTWALDESSGTLTISGSGAMQNYYSISYTPWYSYRTAITTVVVEEGVTGIGNNAFSNFSNLTSAQIPSTVKSIGRSAFFMCRSLTEVRIPAETENIGSSAFFGCSKLAGISVASGNPNYSSDARGVLYNKAKTVLIQAPGGLSGSYTVPQGVTEISEYAFFGCSGLTGITLPEGLSQIGSAVFQNCTKLKVVSVPQTVTAIGNGTFLGCRVLSEIIVDENNSAYSSDASGVLFNKEKTLLIQAPGGMFGSYELPDSVREIAANGFWLCEGLTQVRLPAGLQTIGEAAFAGCFYLESINIPATVTEIPEEAFSGCSAMTKITIPGSVTRIGRKAFDSCESMTEITFAGDAPEIGDKAFANVYADAYYPGSNATWTEAVRQGYGGELQWQTFTLFDIPGVSMSLGNSLAMYYYVPAANVTEGCYAKITMTYADNRADKEATVSFAKWTKDTVEGVEYYLIPFNGIAAKEMTDELTCVVYNGDGAAISNPKTSSVEIYALKQLAATTDANLQRVLVDMLNYGAAAQNQFGYKTNILANAKLTDTQKSWGTGDIDISALHVEPVKGKGWKGCSLILESNIQLAVFFDNTVVTRDMTAKISYTDHYGDLIEYEIPGSAFENYEGTTMLYVSVETLAAADLETVVSIDIMSGDTLVSHNQCSMAQYCTTVETNAMVEALVKYCKAANTFFHP